MIDILTQLAAGFVHCLTPLNMAMLVVGIVIGLLIGVLPGLTLVMGVALALPFTYKILSIRQCLNTHRARGSDRGAAVKS